MPFSSSNPTRLTIRVITDKTIKSLLVYQENDFSFAFLRPNRRLKTKSCSCIGNISEALNYRQHMLCYLLFHYDKDSKSIPRFLNRIKDTKIFREVDKDKKLKQLEEEMTQLLEEASNDIQSLKEYRYDVYAHWNKNVFKTEWQQNFKNEHPFDYGKIIELCTQCYNLLGDMLNLFGEKSFSKALINKKHLDAFISQLK